MFRISKSSPAYYVTLSNQVTDCQSFATCVVYDVSPAELIDQSFYDWFTAQHKPKARN